MIYVLDAIGGLVLLLALLALVLHLIGSSLPAEHRLVCTLRLNQPPDPVYALIADLNAWPTWDTGVTGVDTLPSRNGHDCIRMRMGRNRMILERTRNEPPRIHEMTIADEGAGIFSGAWLHEITPDGSGRLVTLTETARIGPTIPRAMARTLADPALYLKRHFKRIAAHFGETPRIERLPSRPI